MKKMDKVTSVKATIVAFFTALTSALGVLAIPIYLMVGANIIDYLTGIYAAKYRGQEIESYKGIKGIMKKVMMWLLIVVGFIVDMLIMHGASIIDISLPFSFFVTILVTLWILSNELISILENLKDSGVTIPSFLQKLVENIKSQVENKGEDK